MVPATKGMVVSLGLPLLHRNALFNCACLAVDGRIVGFVAKRFLCGDGLHYEPRWFKPWPQGVRDTLTLDGREYPIGDLVFDCGGVKIGFEICEDAWVAGRPGGEHVAAGRRHHPQPQRQPLCLRQVRGPQAAGAGRLAGVPRQLRLRQLAGQRGGTGDLRRRRDDRLGRQAVGRRTAVLLCPLAVDQRRGRRAGHTHEHAPGWPVFSRNWAAQPAGGRVPLRLARGGAGRKPVGQRPPGNRART